MHIDRKRLTGEIWVLTTYFNPLGLKIKKQNFQLFAQNLKRQGAHLAVIENVFTDGASDLLESQADLYVRSEGGDVLWQKERLMNILATKIPESADKIVFCDCDILFMDDQWLKKAAELLEYYRVLQPFSHFIRLEKGLTGPGTRRREKGPGAGEIFHSFALGYNCYKSGEPPFNVIGSPGFSWAFRRSVLKECPLYEYMITGGGDTALAYAFSSSQSINPLADKMPATQQASYDSWWNGARTAFRASLGVLPGTICHLWHGDPANRNYVNRHTILAQAQFDPETDLRAEPGRPLYWASNKPELHQGVADYFASRKEEG